MKTSKRVAGLLLAVSLLGSAWANAQVVVVRRPVRPAVVVVRPRPVLVRRPVVVAPPVVVVPAPPVAVVARPRRVVVW